MNRELSSLIQKISAKTIFNGNVYYMIKWKHLPDSKNIWKPSEYFEQSLYFMFLVEQFEIELSKTEQQFFLKLENEGDFSNDSDISFSKSSCIKEFDTSRFSNIYNDCSQTFNNIILDENINPNIKTKDN